MELLKELKIKNNLDAFCEGLHQINQEYENITMEATENSVEMGDSEYIYLRVYKDATHIFLATEK